MSVRTAGVGPFTLLGAGLLAAAVGLASALNPLLMIAVFAAILLALFVLTQPQAVLMLMIVALPWEGLLDFPTPKITVVKLLGVLLLVSVTLNSIGQGSRLRAPPAAVAAAVFVISAAISLIVSPDASAGITQLLRYTLLAGFFFIVIQLLDDRPRLLRAIRLLTLSLGIAAVYGLVSFLSGSAPRAEGPITEPLEFGYMLAVLLPLCVYLILEDKKLRWLWLPCFAAILAASLATLSRGAFVGLIVMLLWAVLTRRIRLGGLIASSVTLFALVAVGLQLFGPVINERVSQKEQIAGKNTLSREALWAGAVDMWMDRPITGVGTGRFGVESVDYVRDNPIVIVDPQAHNAYLEILAESGPFALAAFLFFLAASWLTLARERRAARDAGKRRAGRLASSLQASLLVAVVGALFLSEQVASPIWVICALAAVFPWTFGSAARSARTAA
jgi:putative inorganic carbon (hco3(-)) transporter